MAIEFLCPYCKAMIRVLDKSAGGKGRCPQCAMRITVPKKSVLPPPSPQPADPQPAEEEAVVLLEADDESHAGEVIEFAEASHQESPPAPFLLEPAERVSSRLGSLPVENTNHKSARPYSRKKQKRTGSWWAISAAVVLISVILGAGYFFTRSLSEKLSGEVVATTAENLELPPALVRKTQFQLAPEVVDELLAKLELNPVPLNSQMMRIELRGTPKGLSIILAAGEKSQFCRVDMNELETLRKFLTQHQMVLEEKRFHDVTNAASEFLETYSRVLAKELPAESVTVFRDSLALPSLVGGLGYQLVAQHARNLYRCVYQDQEGGCYFLLPRGISEFTIIGRTQTEGEVLVPARVDVRVKGIIDPIVNQVEAMRRKSTPKANPDNTDSPGNEDPSVRDK